MCACVAASGLGLVDRCGCCKSGRLGAAPGCSVELWAYDAHAKRGFFRGRPTRGVPLQAVPAGFVRAHRSRSAGRARRSIVYKCHLQPCRLTAWAHCLAKPSAGLLLVCARLPLDVSCPPVCWRSWLGINAAVALSASSGSTVLAFAAPACACSVRAATVPLALGGMIPPKRVVVQKGHHPRGARTAQRPPSCQEPNCMYLLGGNH